MALINYLSRIQFDFGALGCVKDELAGLNVARPLLVTDRGVVAAGHVDRLESALGRPVAACFADTPSNPTEAAAKKALTLYRDGECDGLVALGGGSAMDLAKAVALLASHPGNLADYVMQVGGSEKIGPVVPMLAIPTTAGTGAEVGRAASLTLEGGEKAACVSLNLVPDVAICDPELTLSLPAVMTAASGMDALCHGIEAFISNRVNPPAAAIALDCVTRAGRWLRQAVAHGDDRDARWQMAMAALEGGLTFQKGLGAVHAASHPLGALGLHHGTLNAVLLPAVLAFNAGHCAGPYETLRQALGLDNDVDLSEWAADLRDELGLPSGLRAMGVDAALLPDIAAAAARDHLNETNPRPADAVDFRGILAASMG